MLTARAKDKGVRGAAQIDLMLSANKVMQFQHLTMRPPKASPQDNKNTQI